MVKELIAIGARLSLTRITQDIWDINMPMFTALIDGIEAALLNDQPLGFNLLYSAAERGRTDMVRILLAKEGIELHTPSTRSHKTPLEIAIQKGRPEVVLALEDAIAKAAAIHPGTAAPSPK